MRESVPRCDTSIVSSTMARPATYRASIDVDRAFFSKFLQIGAGDLSAEFRFLAGGRQFVVAFGNR
jgi:hypothetical protein